MKITKPMADPLKDLSPHSGPIPPGSKIIVYNVRGAPAFGNQPFAPVEQDNSKLHRLLRIIVSTSAPRPLYDLRHPSETLRIYHRGEISRTTSEYLSRPATNPPTHQLNIISESLPWTITISKAQNRSAISCWDVLDAVYKQLQEPLTTAEACRLAIGSKFRKKRTNVLPWEKETRPPNEESDVKKRVDFLRGKTTFGGFRKDEALAAKRKVDSDPNVPILVLITLEAMW